MIHVETDVEQHPSHLCSRATSVANTYDGSAYDGSAYDGSTTEALYKSFVQSFV